SLSLYFYADPRALHSFPTRRSSDLVDGAHSAAQLHASLDALEGGERLYAGLRRDAQLRCRRQGGKRIHLVMLARQIPFYGSHGRSEEHTSELQSRENLVCRLLLEKK